MYWNDETPVYIYGAGLKGKLIFELLKKLDCNLYGFLDKTAQNGNMGINVFNPNELSMKKRKCSVVVCSVANVFEHKEIAANLAEQGYIYILYKSFDVGSQKSDELIDIIWNAIEECEQYSLTEIKSLIRETEITAYQCTVKALKKEKLVNENRGYIDVMIPAIFLYTFPKSLYLSIYEGEKEWFRIPYDKNVYYYMYCADLFRVFENGMFSNQEWMSFLRVYKKYFSNAGVYTEKDLDIKFEQHLSQRYSIYKEMNKMFHINRAFFDENPILVKWNKDRCCLYIRDGHNRLAFLLAKGMTNVMCRMKAEDYTSWTSLGVMQKYTFSMENEQANAKIALKWMGKQDLLYGINEVLFFSDNLFLHDTFSKMGICVTAFEKIVEEVKEYRDNIDFLLTEYSGKLLKKISSLEDFDLVWINLTYIHSPAEKNKWIDLLIKFSGIVVVEGTGKDAETFANQLIGRTIESTCIYWNKNEAISINLVQKEVSV